MTWLNENLQVLATLGSALALYVFIRMGARREIVEFRKEMKAEFTEMKAEFTEMKAELKSIDRRLIRLESRFEERGYWESRERKTGSE